MKLLSPVAYRSEPPGAYEAEKMLDMVNMAPLYTSLSNQLRTALMKRIVNVFLDVREWQNLVEEYLQFKKRYYEYPFSFACFEALIHEQIGNSTKNQWQYTVQWGENQINPGIVTFTNPDRFEEFLCGLPGFDEIYNESIGLLIQTTHSATAQLLFEIKRGDQEGMYTFEYRIFILMDRGMQYTKPLVQLMLSDTVSDLQDFYTLFMQFLPEGVSIPEGLYHIPNNQLLQKEVFDQRANDDEKSQYAKIFDPDLYELLDAYCDKTLPQDTKRELFHKVCQNEGWCFFIKQANLLFTYSTVESILKNRPMDTFRLFAPDSDEQKATLTFTGQQRNKELREMIIVLNSFFKNQIKWKNVNGLSREAIGLIIAGEVIDDDKLSITITFGGPTLSMSSKCLGFTEFFTLDEFYQLLTALQINDDDFDRDTIDPFYLGYESGNGNEEGSNEDDFDDYKY